MKPPNRKSCYNFRVTEVVKVIDGDTIDVVIDLGFDLYKKERVRIAGVDTPEKRTRDAEEKALGIDATVWMQTQLQEALDSDSDLIIRTELEGGFGKYGRLLGWLYVGDANVSLNEQMIEDGYAYDVNSFDGGTFRTFIEDVRKMPNGGYGVYADKFKTVKTKDGKTKRQTPGGSRKRTQEVEKMRMITFMIAKVI